MKDESWSRRRRRPATALPTCELRNIDGHFAEHLGHCIYAGIWVGEDSDIPNTRGIRSDVVAASGR